MIIGAMEMKGKDGRVYRLIVENRDGWTPFKIIDVATGEETDDGWFVISKNGVLRDERIK